MEEIKIDKNEEGTYLTENEVTAVRALLQSYPIHNHDGRNSVQVASTKVKNSINSQKIILPTDMVCGEDIDNGDAIMIGSGLNVTHQSARDTYYNGYVEIGGVANTAVLQSFQVSEAVSMTGYVIYAYYNIDRPFTPKLYSDNGGKPGNLLASGSSVNFLGEVWKVAFCPCGYTLQANTTYWIVIIEGAVGTKARSKVDTLKKYTNGSAIFYNFTTGEVTGQNYDCFFGIYFTGEDKLYKAASLDASYTANFVGIANRSNKKGETPEVIVVGVKDNFTGLTTGSKYYLTDDVGKISTTAGYISKQVGYSASESILVINLQ